MTHKVSYNAVSLSWPLFSYAIFFLFKDGAVTFFEREDGLFETATAIWFLMASICFFYLFFRKGHARNLYTTRPNKNVFFLLLGILFFFCFGEEISWGQRIFDFETPEIIKEINMQNETNIHNFKIFHGEYTDGENKTGFAWLVTIETLFTIFWFSYCFLIPVLEKINSNISNWLESTNLPIVPIWIGVLFVLNGVVSEAIDWIISDDKHHFLIEVKESNFAFLFLVAGVWFIKHHRSEKK